MIERFNQIPGPSNEVEDYFTAWTRWAGISIKEGTSVEYTSDAIVYTCALHDDFERLLNMHENFTVYPEYISVTIDTEKQAFMFKDAVEEL